MDRLESNVRQVSEIVDRHRPAPGPADGPKVQDIDDWDQGPDDVTKISPNYLMIELMAAIDRFPQRERAQLVALAQVGRGSHTGDDFGTVVDEKDLVLPDTLYIANLVSNTKYLHAGLAKIGRSN